nr:hypothetical protein BaRGS_013233 [Batillaria attramentaria]
MNVYDLQFQRGDLTASANQRTNRLTLETFTEEDNAVYSCVAKSRTRQSENSNAIRLFVDEKPANVPQKPTLKCKD